MVTEEQLQQWEREHQARIDKLTNLNGPECRDCSPEHPCQVAALIAFRRALAARLAEVEEGRDQAKAQRNAEYTALLEYGKHHQGCAYPQHACDCGLAAALAPGAGGMEG